jgi:hypothetical protein
MWPFSSRAILLPILQMPPESDQAILGWDNYLKSHTIQDMVRLGILGDEFKIRFVNGYDVLLAHDGDANRVDPSGLAIWEEHIRLRGFESAVDRILYNTHKSKYNNKIGDHSVPGWGHAECF